MVRRIYPSLALTVILLACTAEEPAESENSGITTMNVPASRESLSPNLAVGPDGTVVLSWLEQDDGEAVLTFSRLDKGAWLAPREIARGENWFVNWADFPSVVPISSDLWAAHWLVSSAEPWYSYDVNVALSNDAGQTWSEAVLPHRDGTDTEHGFVSMYPDDAGVGLIWLDGRNMVNEVTEDVSASGMTLRAASLSPDLLISNEAVIDGLICDCCQTDVAISNGGPVAIYRDRSTNEIRDIYVSRFVGNAWREGKPMANDNWEIAACPVNGPVIEADGNFVAAAWFTAEGDTPRVQVAFSADSAATFSLPVEIISGDNYGRVGLALLPNGDVAVSWLQKISIDSAEVRVRRVSSDGTLGPAQTISSDDDVPMFSVPRMLRAGNELIFAWTRRIDETTQVTTARVPVEFL